MQVNTNFIKRKFITSWLSGSGWVLVNIKLGENAIDAVIYQILMKHSRHRKKELASLEE
jgi:hypothetical protein